MNVGTNSDITMAIGQYNDRFQMNTGKNGECVSGKESLFQNLLAQLVTQNPQLDNSKQVSEQLLEYTDGMLNSTGEAISSPNEMKNSLNEVVNSLNSLLESQDRLQALDFDTDEESYLDLSNMVGTLLFSNGNLSRIYSDLGQTSNVLNLAEGLTLNNIKAVESQTNQQNILRGFEKTFQSFNKDIGESETQNAFNPDIINKSKDSILVEEKEGLKIQVTEPLKTLNEKEAGSSKQGVENGSRTQEPIQGIPLGHDITSIESQPHSLEKLEPYSQIGQEILSKLEKKGPMEFKLQLEPENLGKIDIKLQLNEGKLIIDIMSASSKTHALLTNQVDKLIQGLGLQNVQVESVQVSHQFNQQSQDSQSQAFVMNGGMNFSQRRQQEQLQEHLNQRNLSNALNLQNVEMSGEIHSMKILRDSSRIMDYAV